MKLNIAVLCSLLALLVGAGLCLGKGTAKPAAPVVGFDLTKDWAYTVVHKAGKDAVTVSSVPYVSPASRKPGESYPLTGYRIYRLSNAGDPSCPTCGIVLCK